MDNIEIDKIFARRETALRLARSQQCIYYTGIKCSAPKVKFKICLSCPRCAALLKQSAMQIMFGHIKNAAALLMSLMSGQASK
jgi:hypothetical protein